jgi:hypothetical protein
MKLGKLLLLGATALAGVASYSGQASAFQSVVDAFSPSGSAGYGLSGSTLTFDNGTHGGSIGPF